MAGERLGQHRLDSPGDVYARPSPVCLVAEQRMLAHVRRDVSDVDPYSPRGVALRSGGDRVVEVAGARRINREGGKRAQVAPLGGSATGVGPRRRDLSSLVLDRGIEGPVQ